MVLKQLGMASVSIQAGVEGFLELEPNSNTRFLSGRTVYGDQCFMILFLWIFLKKFFFVPKKLFFILSSVGKPT